MLAAELGMEPAGEGACIEEGIGRMGTEAGEGTLCGEWMNWPPAGEGPPCCCCCMLIGEPCGIMPPAPPGLGPAMYCMPGLGPIVAPAPAGIMPGCSPPAAPAPTPPGGPTICPLWFIMAI